MVNFMLTILQMYLVQAILYACEILEALEFFFFRMSLRRRVNGIHLEVVANLELDLQKTHALEQKRDM